MISESRRPFDAPFPTVEHYTRAQCVKPGTYLWEARPAKTDLLDEATLLTQRSDENLQNLAELCARLCGTKYGVVYWQGKTSGTIVQGPTTDSERLGRLSSLSRATMTAGLPREERDLFPLFFGVPILLKGQPIGTLAVADTEPLEVSEANRAHLESLGSLAGGLIEGYWLRVELEGAQVQLTSLAPFDPVTGLRNARAFQEALQREFLEARRYGLALSLVVAELDGLGEYAKVFGPAARDELLRMAAGLLRRTRRATDVAAYMGAERFAALLSHTGERGASRFASRFRTRVDEATWANHALTVRVGVAVVRPEMETPEEFLAAAEAYLAAYADGTKEEAGELLPLPPLAHTAA